MTKRPKPAWADEPTPICAKEEVHYSDVCLSSAIDFVDAYVARDLERRLRHALKLVNSLRIDVMSNQGGLCDPEPIEQQLSAIEEVLQ